VASCLRKRSISAIDATLTPQPLTQGHAKFVLIAFMGRQLWRFVYVQKRVAELAQTAIDYPPMQAPASFNLDAVKAQVEDAIKAHQSRELAKRHLRARHRVRSQFSA
jgi:hypothetical protein